VTITKCNGQISIQVTPLKHSKVRLFSSAELYRQQTTTISFYPRPPTFSYI